MAKAMLNKLDSGCGDGDCGSTLKRGASKLLKDSLPSENAANLMDKVSAVAEAEMGGSAGAMYSIFFASAASAMRKEADENVAGVVADALVAGAEAIMLYGQARPGDRTMLDALVPAVNVFREKVRR